jgi:hypothetical protein
MQLFPPTNTEPENFQALAIGLIEKGGEYGFRPGHKNNRK